MFLTEFQNIDELKEYFTDEQICIEYLENMRWGNYVQSPFVAKDTLNKIYKCSGNRYKCTSTNKYFNIRTKSIFADSKISLQKWIIAVHHICVDDPKISSYKLAKQLEVAQTNAWFMQYRIKMAIKHSSLWIEVKTLPPLKSHSLDDYFEYLNS